MMTPQNYKVYKALAEDITVPYIWVSNPRRTLKPRQIARITNHANHKAKKSIFCKVLEIDENYKKRYKRRTGNCSLSSTDFVAVMNGWYRERLGIEKTGKDFKTNLEIEQAYGWPLSFCAEIIAARMHPDYNVKLAVILGILGLVLGIISLSVNLAIILGILGIALVIITLFK